MVCEIFAVKRRNSAQRGANCHPEQIVVVGGMQQAMLACALALINEGEVAWIEDPVLLQARTVLAFVGAKIVPRPIPAASDCNPPALQEHG